MTVQLISLFGAVLCLGAYASLQLGRTVATGWRYLWANLVAGVILTVVALVERQWGFLLMEGAWALIAATGMVRRMRNGSATGNAVKAP